MKKAAVYPFDKITRGLVKFRDELNFQINTVIDFVFNIGEDAGDNADGKYAGIPIINDVEKALEDVDALIINSMRGPIYSESDIKLYEKYEVEKKWRDMVIKANQKGIEIISIHDVVDAELKEWLQKNNIKLTTYSKSDEEIEKFIAEGKKINIENKAHRIGIYATRGCVGKYTAQMHLLKAMKKEEMKVGALVTEPVGRFFGQYDGDPLRFRMFKNPMRYVYYMEALTKRAEADGNDYIIMADQQSITSHYFVEEVASKISLLKAYNPDTILLVVGYDDDANIQDCLDIFRIYCDGKKPISLLIPDRLEVAYGTYEVKTKEEIEMRKTALRNKFNIENIEVVSDVGRVIQKIKC
ncbi:MAG: DUF1611 domain-containing protein [Bacillota bacterium]|nr:DUF1611 domain-containing protein [Bacillota bacterium]